MITESIITRTS